MLSYILTALISLMLGAAIGFFTFAFISANKEAAKAEKQHEELTAKDTSTTPDCAEHNVNIGNTSI